MAGPSLVVAVHLWAAFPHVCTCTADVSDSDCIQVIHDVERIADALNAELVELEGMG